MVKFERRTFIAGATAAAFAGPALKAGEVGGASMYGLIGNMTAKPGQREALMAAILGEGTPMPGCLSYVVAADASNPDLIWISEAWTSGDAHRASLSLPSVQQAIAKARPLLAGMNSVAKTVPFGGIGLKLAPAQPEAAQPLFAITLRPGPAWKAGRPFAEQGLGEHFRFWKARFDRGEVFSAGPLGADSGLVLLYSADQAAADTVLSADPAIKTGIFVGEARPYSPPMASKEPLSTPKP